MDDVLNREPLVSIVIPVYNAEKGLSKCLDSVLSQTYKNIEVILVDDGSHDTSPDICKTYKEGYPEKITFISQKNGGPAAARNKGIELSQGKYIAFVDSDDTIAPNMISTLTGKGEAEDVEMVICAYWKVTGKGQTERTFTLPEGLYAEGDQKKILYSLLDENVGDIRPYSWIRFTRRSVFEESGLRFSERLYRSEDFHFWARVHSVIKRVYLCSRTPLYYYFENDASITHNHVKGYWDDVQYIYSDLKKHLNDDAVASEKLDVMLVKRSLIALNNAAFSSHAKDAYREIKEVVGNKELNQIIQRLDISGSARFTRYRFLMSKGWKGAITGKYMLRWVKSRGIRS